ncbi:MAG TPA: CHAP domain-containing protein [Ktedonobacterales bacterium]
MVLSLLGALVLLAGCAVQASPATRHAATPSPTARPVPAYVDARLGFSIALPAGWTAQPSPGLHAAENAAAVALTDPAHPGTLVLVSVLRGTDMPGAFARRGTPTTTIGPYPAFVEDTSAAEGRVPCLIRIFLARDDDVTGEECAADAPAHRAALDALLASYTPTAPANVLRVGPLAAAQQSCAAVQRQQGYDPANAGWGHQLARPGATSPAAGWGNEQPGVYLCANDGSPDRYLFQCTELVNRFDWELFDLPRFTDHSELYFDYYQDGTRQPGQVRALFPAGTYALSDDAAQGTSAFAPAPGDLLVFQDVNDAARGWTSGIRPGTLGHVAIVTAVDATHVYVAQENYNDTQYFLALPLAHTAAGWHITDLSGVSNRIVRGWIRLTAPAS